MSKKETTGKKSNLFEEFPPTGLNEWKRQIMEDLRGADYTKKLIWKTPEGFDVEPFYTSADLESLSYLTDTLPGEYPFVRGNGKSENKWEVCEEIHGENIKESNLAAIEALNSGADSVTFAGASLNNTNDIPELLKNVQIGKKGLNFIIDTDSLDIWKILSTEADRKKISPLNVSGVFYFSPLNYLLTNGLESLNIDKSFEMTRDFISDVDSTLPGYKTLAVDSAIFGRDGLNIVQELAFSMAMGCEYLVKLEQMGLGVDFTSQKMVFNFAVSSNYFMEIAKLRAARILWAKIVERFKPEKLTSCKMTLHCKTSGGSGTLSDPYIKILGDTVESMAAIIGGCDTLTLPPFEDGSDSEKKYPNRLTRNTQLVLRQEAYLDKITDPGSGSYYIEKLTDTLANEALKLFQDAENMGGFIKCVENSFISDRI